MSAPAPTIEDAITIAQQVLASIKIKMLDDSATSRRAFSDANDALTTLSNAAKLAQWELARQHETARARIAAATQKEAAEKARAEREERARHEAVLKREQARTQALESARTYLKKRQTQTKETNT